MDGSLLLIALLVVPFATAPACLLACSPRAVLGWSLAGGLLEGALGLAAAWQAFGDGPLFAAGQWLFLDALSAYNLAVLLVVYLLSTLYAFRYFAHEREAEGWTLRTARQFGGLWTGALGAMVVVLLSNNLGILWVGIEGTTVLTAFLICLHVTSVSLEAMWKYLLICSVGVGLAFMGTLLVAKSAVPLGLEPATTLLWTTLRDHAAHLDPGPARAGFLFLLVGYGTKAGLAPMHSWLPDAHSQAPAPVSALFSGFMLNTALYCLMRYLPIVEAANGHSGWAQQLLVMFGLASILVAAAFLLFQQDLKRLLAYSSVEHLGVITLGLGLGGLGTFAALFHSANHSLAKTLAFFSAGRLGQSHGTHDLSALRGTLRTHPAWGTGMLGALLALLGVAPFAPFMSELAIARAAVQSGATWTLILFLAGLSVVFVGVLRYVLGLAWGRPDREPLPERRGVLDVLLVVVPLGVLLLLGLWLPAPFEAVLLQAARVIGGAP